MQKPNSPNFRLAADLMRVFAQQWATVVGGEAVRESREAFRGSDWDGVGWQDRKRNPAWGDGDRSDAPNRRLLVKTGRLRRSIKIIRQRTGEVVIGSDVPYAAIHNEGGVISGSFQVRKHTRRSTRGKSYEVKAHSRTVRVAIPKRQFMGESRRFEHKVADIINRKVKQLEAALLT